jgi:hypothetical protein
MTGAPERPGPPPVFHEKRTYRRRRLMDAARVVPIFAAVLWAVPMLWPQSGEDRVSSAGALVYIFIVWVCVIVITGAISRGLRRDDAASRDAEK